MSKVVGYIRVSTDTQSVANQKLKILEYARLNKIIIDDFVSIEISTRKNQKDRKIDEIKALLKKDDTLIVTELSRLGRNMLEILNLIEHFNQNSVKIIFTNQPELSTTGKNDALSSLLFSIYGYFAEAEREIISTRTKQGLEKAKASGKKLGRPVGTSGASKLDGKKKDIENMLYKGLNPTNIARMLEVSRPCLQHFIDTRIGA